MNKQEKKNKNNKKKKITAMNNRRRRKNMIIEQHLHAIVLAFYKALQGTGRREMLRFVTLNLKLLFRLVILGYVVAIFFITIVNRYIVFSFQFDALFCVFPLSLSSCASLNLSLSSRIFFLDQHTRTKFLSNQKQ